MQVFLGEGEQSYGGVLMGVDAFGRGVVVGEVALLVYFFPLRLLAGGSVVVVLVAAVAAGRSRGVRRLLRRYQWIQVLRGRGRQIVDSRYRLE